MTKNTRGRNRQGSTSIAGVPDKNFERKSDEKDRTVYRVKKPQPSEVEASAPTSEETFHEDTAVAARLDISPLTLRKWRCLKSQPLPYLKIGRIIRYRESDVQRFLESKMVRFGEVR